MPKILYTFTGSVWAAAAELAVAELGYTDAEITTKFTSLVDGENFLPSFLSKNPKATLPTLEDTDGKIYTTTADVVAALIKDAPLKVKSSTDPTIIEILHDDKYDPNFALTLSRNEEELAVKGPAIAEILLKRRQVVLEKLVDDPEAAPFKAFLDSRKVQNAGFLAIQTNTAPAEAKTAFFASSQAHFDRVKTAVYEVVPGFLPESGFIGGNVPGEADFHVGAWLTRIAATHGAKSAETALDAFEKAYGAPVPAKISAYWGAWTVRDSWKKVYVNGLGPQ
ncbi:hypothetical protein C8F01DRAFT_502360 [Mycena amicta]|nr:hypothetical protein C8F01DRAFT_502360 [Mycena amicta]